MKHQSTLKISAFLFSLLLSLPVFAAQGDAKAGEAASAICSACHQANGMGMNIPSGESWPRLAGLDATYIYKQLQDFKSKKRANDSMFPFANMLTDKQMLDLAAFYSQQQPQNLQVDADAELLNQGEKLVNYGDWNRYIVPCASCHGPANQGAGSNFPGIAGQQPAYIEAQLNNWKSGKRDNDPQHLMLAIAERMSAQDIKAVAAWLATQPAK